MLRVGVTEIVQLVFVTLLECKSVLHVLHVRYLLLINMFQVVYMC